MACAHKGPACISLAPACPHAVADVADEGDSDQDEGVLDGVRPEEARYEDFFGPRKATPFKRPAGARDAEHAGGPAAKRIRAAAAAAAVGGGSSDEGGGYSDEEGLEDGDVDGGGLDFGIGGGWGGGVLAGWRVPWGMAQGCS
mgnify:CR=1 FL=1